MRGVTTAKGERGERINGERERERVCVCVCVLGELESPAAVMLAH